MRRVTAILSGAAVVVMAAGLFAQAKPSFAGEWKIVADPAADGSGGRGGGPGIDLTITQSAAAITVEYRGGGQAPAPVKLTCKLDGSVSKNMVAGRGGGVPTEQVSKAMWAGNNLVVTTTTGAGEEKRTFSMDGVYLIVETSGPARHVGAPNITKVTYKKYERGFGG
jgi:hypothetical protein